MLTVGDGLVAQVPELLLSIASAAIVTRVTSPLDLAHYLSLHPIVRPIAFTARRLALMSSRDSIGGGPYVLEAAYPLGPAYPNRLPSGAAQRR